MTETQSYQNLLIAQDIELKQLPSSFDQTIGAPGNQGQ
jgi:hypothetical protein